MPSSRVTCGQRGRVTTSTSLDSLGAGQLRDRRLRNRNGYRGRHWDTRDRHVGLAIPKVRYSRSRSGSWPGTAQPPPRPDPPVTRRRNEIGVAPGHAGTTPGRARSDENSSVTPTGGSPSTRPVGAISRGRRWRLPPALIRPQLRATGNSPAAWSARPRYATPSPRHGASPP